MLPGWTAPKILWLKENEPEKLRVGKQHSASA